jgi:hypothetical protein
LWLVFVLFFLFSCSNVVYDTISTDRRGLEQSFTDWCVDLDLVCTEETTGPIPSLTDAWTEEQWRAAWVLVQAFLLNSGELSFTDADLSDADFNELVTSLAGPEAMPLFTARAEATRWLAFTKPAHEAQLWSTFDGVASWDTESGLQVTSEATMEMRLHPDGSMDLEGLAVTPPLGTEPLEVGSFARVTSETGTLAVNGDLITNVPLRGALEIAVGDLVRLPLPSGVDGPAALLGLLRPLVHWTSAQEQSITVARPFFEVAREQIPVLVSPDAGSQLVYPFVEAIDALSTGPLDSGEVLRVTFRPGAEIDCSLAGSPVSLRMHDGEVLVESIWDEEEADTVGIRVSGVEARINVLWGYTFTPRHLEISPEAIKVYDVPVLGSYSISSEELEQLSCRTSF